MPNITAATARLVTVTSEINPCSEYRALQPMRDVRLSWVFRRAAPRCVLQGYAGILTYKVGVTLENY